MGTLVTRSWTDISRKLLGALAGGLAGGGLTVAGVDQVLLWLWNGVFGFAGTGGEMPATIAAVIGTLIGAVIGGYFPKDALPAEQTIAQNVTTVGTKVQSHPLVTCAAVGLTLVVLLLALGGCASSLAVSGTQQQQVYALKADYAMLLTGIAGYEKLPRCLASQTFIADRCSDPAAVDQIRKADDTADAAADAAETIVRTQGTGDAVTEALSAAQVALDALQAIYTQSQKG
jgi:hypothetical protein